MSTRQEHTDVSLDESSEPKPLALDFAGETFVVTAGRPFIIGRKGDLAIDDNPFLHRGMLRIVARGDLWWVENIGTRLSATVTDGQGRVQAWLAPGARIPMVFRAMTVVFTAGTTTYEMTLLSEQPTFEEAGLADLEATQTTLGSVTFTSAQRLAIVALAEPMLRREGVGMSELPTSAVAAKRLGWTLTRFNRKLDNICDKLDRAGVPGLRGEADRHATNRRARLVEYAVAARLVTRADLELMERARETEETSP